MKQDPDLLTQVSLDAPAILATAKSLVQFAGPFRHYHPEWPDVEAKARASLSAEDATRAADLDTALRHLETAESTYSQLRHDLELLKDGKITTAAEHPLPLFDELLEQGLLKFAPAPSASGARGNAVIEDFDAAKRVASKLIDASSYVLKTAKDAASRAQRSAAGPCNRAEAAAASSWMREQASKIEKLRPNLVMFVDEFSLDLAGITGGEPHDYLGRPYSSTCAALCDITATLVQAIPSSGDERALQPEVDANLATIDFEELEARIELELAELHRNLRRDGFRYRPSNPVDVVFKRVITRGRGKRLGFAQIFGQAKSDPDTRHLFPMAHCNRDHEKRVCALVGSETSDGWIIYANAGGRGCRREFWVARQEDRDS
jgi:hypothetical protein